MSLNCLYAEIYNSNSNSNVKIAFWADIIKYFNKTLQ